MQGPKIEIKMLAMKLLGYLSLGFLFTVVFLGISEGVLRIVGFNKQKITYQRDEKLYTSHPHLGQFHRPNISKLKENLFLDGKFLTTKTISTDSYGRRFPYLDEAYPSKKKSVIVFGCSFTFGRGLSNNETLVYHLADLDNDKIYYNYAMNTGGPHDMLAWLESNELRSQIFSPPSLGIFVFIQDHYFRAIGAVGRRQNAPYYSLENASLVRKGTFETARPINSRFWSFVVETKVFQAMQMLTSSSKSSEVKLPGHQLDLFCSILKKSRELFLHQFPGSKFVIVSYDRNWYNESIKTAFSKCILENNLDYIEYTGKQDPKDFDPNDGHPTSQQNRKLAEFILNHIRN